MHMYQVFHYLQIKACEYKIICYNIFLHGLGNLAFKQFVKVLHKFSI